MVACCNISKCDLVFHIHIVWYRTAFNSNLIKTFASASAHPTSQPVPSPPEHRLEGAFIVATELVVRLLEDDL